MSEKTYSVPISKMVVILLILFLQVNTINAQKCQHPDSVNIINFYRADSIFSFRSQKGYFPSLIHNFGEQATAPFHFQAKQWLITGAAAGITAGLIIIDNDIDDWATVQKDKHKWVYTTSPVITQFGSNAGIFSAIGFGLVSAACKNEKGVQTSLLATRAMITSGLWVHVIKLVSGRERPDQAYVFSKSEGGKFYGPFAQFDLDLELKKPGSSFNSFPSGHTATAFSIATVFAMQYKDKPAVPIISYSLASLVGLSRLTEHKHWASDVFAGAVIGYLCGRQVVSSFEKTHRNVENLSFSTPTSRAQLCFYQSGNGIGLLLIW